MSRVPDTSLMRRVNDLESQLQVMQTQLLRQSQVAKVVTPLNARLWVFELNEDMGASTAQEGAADLLTLDGTDTLLDIVVKDLLDLHSDAESGDQGYCLEQIDLDGDPYYVTMTPGGTAGKKPFCRFVTTASFTTSSATVAGTAVTQWGNGSTHATTTGLTFNNLLTHTAGTYVFEGDNADAGIATYSGTGTTWHIVQMECP